MTQGLSVTSLRKNNSESTKINFRLNPNAHINSYVINVYKHSQSMLKERHTWINSMLQVCSQWFVISVRLSRNRGNINAKYMSTRMNENNKISAKKGSSHT